MQILVIEDSDSIAAMITALVSGRGHEVRGAASGAQGLEAAASFAPDIILIDWALGGAISGPETCARLRREASTRETPFLVFGDTDEEAKRQAIDAGALAYYTKPWSALALLKEIESVRRRSSGRIRLR
ncbi:MAG: response regulator [Myxococcales bacterium]|nr:response regulator [Myxococcales bacterium]